MFVQLRTLVIQIKCNVAFNLTHNGFVGYGKTNTLQNH
jgi:hypothetical protein